MFSQIKMYIIIGVVVVIALLGGTILIEELRIGKLDKTIAELNVKIVDRDSEIKVVKNNVVDCEASKKSIKDELTRMSQMFTDMQTADAQHARNTATIAGVVATYAKDTVSGKNSNAFTKCPDSANVNEALNKLFMQKNKEVVK
jgi:hypothetical protein